MDFTTLHDDKVVINSSLCNYLFNYSCCLSFNSQEILFY